MNPFPKSHWIGKLHSYKDAPNWNLETVFYFTRRATIIENSKRQVV
jgi:hypothetical protein